MKVLNASRYNFNDSESGRVVSGCKVTYVGETQVSDTRKGAEVITVTGPEEVFHQLPPLPADVDLKVSVVMRSGKPSVALLGVVAPPSASR